MKKSNIINLKELTAKQKKRQQVPKSTPRPTQPRIKNEAKLEAPQNLPTLEETIFPDTSRHTFPKEQIRPQSTVHQESEPVEIHETDPFQASNQDGFIDFDLPIDHVWETSLRNQKISFTPPKQKSTWQKFQDRIENVTSGFSMPKWRPSLPEIPSLSSASGKFSRAQMAVFVLASFGVFGVVVLAGARTFAEDTISLARIQAGITGEDVQQSVATSDLALIADSMDAASQDLKEFQAQMVNVSGQGNSSRFVAGIVGAWSKDIIFESGDLAAALAQVSRDLSPFLANQVDPFNENSEVNLVDVLESLDDSLAALRTELEEFKEAYERLPTWLAPVDGAQLTAIDTTLEMGQASLEDIEKYVEVTKELVGSDTKKTYLFIFQNNQEARATGGFIGTFGLLTIDKGVVESLDIKEIYNPDGQLRDKIVAPEPIQELTPRWFLRDSNWFPDFPKSSEKIMDFYEKTGGPTVDGIISLTPTVIERFLRITGDIEMPEYGITVNSDNFLLVTQYQTSVAYDKEENKPKQFVADLAPILLNRILSPQGDLGELANLVGQAIEEKHMLFYLNNEDKQELLSDLGVTGEIRQTNGDYLMVVNSNIGGMKTDGVMREDINHQVRQQIDGSFINTVTITRTHKGGNTEYEWWNDENINFMRVYVPQGSKLIRAEGFDYRPRDPLMNERIAGFTRDNDIRSLESNQIEYPEYDLVEQSDSGRTVFAGWVVTPPQQERTVVLEYELPFKKRNWYSLVTQKQHGSLSTNYTFDFDSARRSPRVFDSSFDVTPESDTIQASTILRTDQAIGIELN
jgi:hypothetical protein